MDVFLIPIGAQGYDLYCEVEDVPSESFGERPQGFFRRLRHGFNVMLAEAEHERHHGRTAPARGWFGRVKARTLRWVSESIAEQRLLWHLRRQRSARLCHPDDIEGVEARDVLRRQLGRDFDRHRWWLTVDSLGLVASALLIIVPGPNIIGYYFAFRVVGHYLSLRGARNGLGAVEWRFEPSGELSRLRNAQALEGEPRDVLVSGVAQALGLEHLPRFFARVGR